jgi:predicted metalloenzyme YecM
LKITGEQLSADTSHIQPFKDKIQDIVTEMKLSLNHIYNMDETALYVEQLSSKTLVSSDEKNARGHKI